MNQIGLTMSGEMSMLATNATELLSIKPNAAITLTKQFKVQDMTKTNKQLKTKARNKWELRISTNNKTTVHL